MGVKPFPRCFGVGGYPHRLGGNNSWSLHSQEMEPGLKRHKVEMSVPSLGTSPDPGNHMHMTSLESSLMVWKISVAGSRLSPKLETELFLPT